MANRIEHGISGVVIAKMTADGSATTAPTYGDVIAWPGAVKLSIDADSESTNFAADNDPRYWTGYKTAGNSGTLEVATVPDEVKQAIYGWTEDAAGILAETEQTELPRFALGYQVEGDVNGRRVWRYNVTFGGLSEEHDTDTDSIDPDTVSISWTGAKVNNSGVNTYAGQCAAGSTAYASFLTSVTLPAKA